MADEHAARRRKPRHPPPPLTRSAQGPRLPHAVVLDELCSPAGVLLWQLLRDATLWSTAGRAERAGLFADAARGTTGAVPEVEQELDALAVLVRDPHPDAGPLIARMCDRVRMWAEGEGLYGTALEFAQAAALADPEDARLAYEVGRMARIRAEYARAEVWYQRAVVLGRRSGDNEARALGYSGIANMYTQRGNYAAARQLKEKAVRLARRHSLRDVLGGAHHDLAVLDFETGNVKDGMHHARKALQVLGAGHSDLPVVVQDVSAALMEQCGAFTAARQVLLAVLPHISNRGAHMMALANLARAAGATGERQLFEAVWTEAWSLLGVPRGPTCTDALLVLSRGAASLGQWDRAREAASRALALARMRREGKAIYQAEALLDALGAEQQFRMHAPTTSGAESPAIQPFVRDLIKSIRVQPVTPDEQLIRLAAVLEAPGDPRRVYALARALRSAAEYERGAAWFEHGIRLAREAGDPTGEAMCLGGLGNLHLQSGNWSLAYELHKQHLELSRRQGLREMEAYALVDLCAVCFTMGMGETGLEYAREALTVVNPENALCTRLAHDVAMYLMECRGDFTNALAIFQALLTRPLPDDFKLIVRASVSRAAAGSGYAQLFENTWAELWSDIQRLPDVESSSGALIQLAQAALIRGHSSLAEEAARHALRVATVRGEAQNAAAAETRVKEAVNAGKARSRVAAHAIMSHNHRGASRLTRGLVTVLRGGGIRES